MLLVSKTAVAAMHSTERRTLNVVVFEVFRVLELLAVGFQFGCESWFRGNVDKILLVATVLQLKTMQVITNPDSGWQRV